MPELFTTSFQRNDVIAKPLVLILVGSAFLLKTVFSKSLLRRFPSISLIPALIVYVASIVDKSAVVANVKGIDVRAAIVGTTSTILV